MTVSTKIQSSEIQSNIQTGNSFSLTIFNDYEEVSYQEHLGQGKFLIVVFRSEHESLMFWQSEDGLITDNLGDQSCLDDCLETIESNEVIPGWYSPQTLGV
jgi:hypothetical protein